MKTRSLNQKKPLVVVAFALVAFVLTGCGALRNDAWQVTYELSTDSSNDTSLSEVEYLHQETRRDEQETKTEESVTVNGSKNWTVETIAVVGKNLKISAVPTGQEQVTCRILLDGKREVSTATGKPGEAVSCETVAPEFNK